MKPQTVLPPAGNKVLREVDIARLVASPDQYRPVHRDAAFDELAADIARQGIISPLDVRPWEDRSAGLDACRKAVGVQLYEVLAGMHRWEGAKVAGLKTVPVFDHGGISDAEAFSIMASTNKHRPLTPLEAGKMVATWLDKYDQDARAVGAYFGQTERWVRLHAQIDRGLIQAWKEAAVAGPEQKNRYGYAGAAREDFRKWTAGHWILIARLPAKTQEYWLEKIHKDYRLDPHDATVEEVEGWLKCETLLLAKSPFDAAGCEGCDRRTDSISQLLWDEPDAKDTGEVRCLDGKCWSRKAAKGRKEDFRVLAEAAVENSNTRVPDPLPISMIEEPEDWSGRLKYAVKIRPIKKAFGKALMELGRIEIVKQGDKGAVPGIVVAGRGKGSLKWVRIAEKPKDTGHGGTRAPTAAEIAKEAKKKETAKRWDTVMRAAFLEISKADRPVYTAVLLCCLRAGAWPQAGHGFDKGTKKLWAGLLDAHDTGSMPNAVNLFWDASWAQFRVWAEQKSKYCYMDGDLPRLRDIAPLFGIDLNARYQALAAKEQAKDESKTPPEGGTPNAKGGKGRTAGKEAPERKCRVCGCTDMNCSGCVEKTGEACHWVEDDLCSACADIASLAVDHIHLTAGPASAIESGGVGR